MITAARNLDPEREFREVDAVRALLVAAPDVSTRESVLWELLEGDCLDRPLVGIGGPRWDGTLARESAWLHGLAGVERMSTLSQLISRHPFLNDEDELVVKELVDLVKSNTTRIAKISLRMVWLVALRLSWEWREFDLRMPATLSFEEKLRAKSQVQLTPFLTKLVASFLDQGMGQWHLPKREEGFLVAALSLLTTPVVGRSWLLQGIEHLAATLDGNQPYQLIAKILSDRGVPETQWTNVLLRESLDLKGGAGFMQLISNRSDITTLSPRA